MNRPTFFISSTIYDFRDLRSALKYHLEQQGCKVLASEFNDFEKPLDQHSYDACLKSIHGADYFVLLVGPRVGGWYDSGNRISITQREYREAYGLQKHGKLKLINFVRSEVWQAKGDRKALAQFLKSTAVDEAARLHIANHPSKSMDDAEFLIAFLNEVGRNRETKLATQGKADPPRGNWIHPFDNFRDVVDVIQRQVFSSLPVEDLIARRLLRSELFEILGKCLVKSQGEPYSPKATVEGFHKKNPTAAADKLAKLTAVETKSWDRLSFIAIHLIGWRVTPIVLPEILTRSTFLEFDLSSNSYKESDVYEALRRLHNEIRHINRALERGPLEVLYKHSKGARRGTAGARISIETMPLLTLLNVLDRWVNILELSRSIIRCLDGLDGGRFSMPTLRSDSPVLGMQQQIDAEKPTIDEVTSFISQ